MPITFHDPRGETRVAPEPYLPRLTERDAPTIGLLANNFPDSVPFLESVERALADALPGASFRHYVKPGASAPAKAKLVEAIASECDALVTAYGH